MVFGKHAELAFGVTVVTLNDHGGGDDGDGDSDGSRHDTRRELSDFIECLRDALHFYCSFAIVPAAKFPERSPD